MYDKDNVFAKIINNELPSNKVYEDEILLAFHDAHPVAPIHILVVPKGEYIDYSDFITNAPAEDVMYYFSKISDIITDLGLEKDGYRLITNKGTKSGQTIFHFHTHIIGGRNITGLAG